MRQRARLGRLAMPITSFPLLTVFTRLLEHNELRVVGGGAEEEFHLLHRPHGPEHVLARPNGKLAFGGARGRRPEQLKELRMEPERRKRGLGVVEGPQDELKSECTHTHNKHTHTHTSNTQSSTKRKHQRLLLPSLQRCAHVIVRTCYLRVRHHAAQTAHVRMRRQAVQVRGRTVPGRPCTHSVCADIHKHFFPYFPKRLHRVREHRRPTRVEMQLHSVRGKIK